MSANLTERRQRLEDYLATIEGQPFAWGSLDCALFAADAVRAMTGQDLGASFRGQYTDADSADAAIRAAGFDTVADIAAAHFTEISRGEAVMGDIAVVEMSGRPCLAIVNTTNIFCMTLRGKGVLPLMKASRIFRV
jgi:hypothetical protein